MGEMANHTTDRIALLRRRVTRLDALREVCMELSSERRLDRLLNLIMRRTTEVLNAERSSLYLVEEPDVLVTQVAQGVEQIRVSIDETSLAGAAAATGETINVQDAYQDPRFNSSFDRRNNFRTRSILTVPMRNRQGEIIGVVQAINKRDRGAFDEEDVRILSAFAAQAAIAVENARYYEQQQQTFEALIYGQALAVDARDHLTSGHTWRVTEYAVEIGREMGLSAEDLEILRYAGLLHDQGKIGVPDRVLQKPGTLTEEEFTLIKSHAAKTKLILNTIRSYFPRRLRGIPDIAAYHHEKLDGSGYPDGLEGEEIPLGARIVAVADIFDALTSKRHYRKPSPDKQVIEMLQQNVAHGKLDGRVVDALVSALSRIVKIRIRLGQQQEEAEKTGGLSGISHLRVIVPEWEKAAEETLR